MIEQGFLKTHFVGRDGFVWWIGQVAPKETWQGNFGSGGETKDSKDIEGFGERYRVRIMGYHTANKDDLPDDELPFATVMYPVTGGAGGDAATTSNIRQGNFVFGFFLDGEDAQQPVIMGLIGYNNYQEVMDAVPSIGFKPFYGLDGKKPSGGELSQTQTDPLRQQTTSNVSGATDGSSSVANNTSGGGNNTTARNVTGVDGHKNLTRAKSVAESDDPSEAIPKSIPNANTNDMNMKGIQFALQKAIQEIENIKRTIRTVASDQLDTLNNLQEEINKKIDIASSAIASAIKWVYQMVEENILKNMDKAFKKVFSLAKPSEQQAVAEKSSQITDTVACFFRRLFAGLLGMVRNFIAEAIDKVVNVPVCFVEKFTGNVLGFVSGFLSNAMEGITGLISGAVDLASEGLDLAADVMNTVSNILSFLNCDEFPDESPVSEWSHIYGSGPQFGKGDVANILNKAKDYASKAKTQGLEALDTFDFAKEANFSELLDVKSQLDGCITDEFPCGPPNLNIFGSKEGAGAVGNLIINAAGNVIGVDMQSFGVGYNDQTRANVIDLCGNGKGAVLRPVFGNVNNAFSGPGPSGPSNPGTPAFSPGGLGFGPFASNPYPFSNDTPGSQRTSPYNPGGKAFGTPAYGLGPSYAKIGKKTPKTSLGITSSTYTVDFEIETFTIPVAKTPAKPVVKFVLLKKNTQLLTIDTDFDFTPDDISGKGRLDKNGQVVVGVGTGKFALAPKSTIVQDGKELEFQEAFDGGQNQRVIKGEKYLVRGFQFDGDPLQNPIKISNDGKCAKIDAVEGATVDTVARQVQVVDNTFGMVNFKVTTDAKYANGINIKGLFNQKKKYDGDDLNFDETIQVELGKVYDVDIISPESRAGVRLRTNKDGNVLEMEDHTDNDWTDIICTVSEGTFFDLKDGSTNGQPKNRASCKFKLDKVITFKTVYDDVKSPGVSDDDYNDMVICAKKGKFTLPNSQKLKAEGAVIYILEDDPGPSGPTSPTTPTTIPSPGAPALPIPDFSIVSPGPTSGGIPGTLTPGPKNNSTFHPFPGSTTLGPGKWVPGPVPPGGGGPHVGPAVFIHDGQLFGELTGKQGAPAPSAVGPIGSFGSNTGGAGGQQPGAIDPGSIPPSWIPGSIGGGGGGGTPPPGGITPAFPANPISPNSPGGFDPGGIGGGGPGDPGFDPTGLGPIGPITALPPGPGTYYPDNATGVGPITGIPVAPGVMVPPELGGIGGPGIGIVDIIVEDGGSGYLGSPDGSTGGDGRTYSKPSETRIQYSDGVKEVPVPSNNRICVDAGDTVILPYGTEVITEPFDGEGGGELIIGGAPHVMQQPGCFTTPIGSLKPPTDGTYPVLMYLCDVIIKKPGFGYKNTDKVVIEPSMGAAAELVVDKFGRITDVLITKPGEGFQEIPKITVESFEGQNADLLAKLCIDRVRDIDLVDQEKVIQVVDCVGKF